MVAFIFFHGSSHSSHALHIEASTEIFREFIQTPCFISAASKIQNATPSKLLSCSVSFWLDQTFSNKL